jgi:hypothetical protein
MEEPLKDVWGQVADGFSSLGQSMKDRYRGEDDAPSPADDADAARDALREAFERLVSAGRDVGQRAVDTLRDDDVRAQAKQAASTLNDALSATVDLIGREVGGLFRPRADHPRDPGRTDEVADPAVVGVPPETPDAVRPSATGLVTGPLDTETDVVVADAAKPVDPEGGTPT